MAPPPPPSSSGGGLAKFLLALVIALMIATGYLYYQIQQIQADVAATRDSLSDQLAKFRETSAVSLQTSKKSVDQLKVEVDAARAQASQLVGQAKVDADKHADELAARLDKEQQVQAARVSAISNDVGQVKEQATTANTRIGEVSTDVSNVKTDLSTTKSDLEKTIATLKAAQGDLGVQSGLIATNGKELSALKQLGERNYTEFNLGKTKAPQKVGDIAVLLKKTDPKKNRYTIEVVADDKMVEKKDRTINEPVQFLLSRASQPYELVVNEVSKDKIKGYVSAPKVQTPRGK
jgi:predicted  nucleic acid-binding Zn-ribbon protein